MRAAYDSIYFDLKESIDDGTYVYKDYLPSESILVKRYGCAHNTVRKALEILARGGYVQPIHGKGVRVIYRAPHPTGKVFRTYELNGIDSFACSVRRQGFSARTKVLSMETQTVDEPLSIISGFDLGQEVIRLERIRFVDDKPLEREINYFRSDIVEGMTAEDAERSIYRYIEEVRGGKLVTCKRVVTVEHINDRDHELIMLGDADYLAVVTCETYDGEGLLCEFTTVRHAPDMFLMAQTAIRTRVSRRQA